MRYQKPDDISNLERKTNSEFNKYKQNQYKKFVRLIIDYLLSHVTSSPCLHF